MSSWKITVAHRANDLALIDDGKRLAIMLLPKNLSEKDNSLAFSGCLHGVMCNTSVFNDVRWPFFFHILRLHTRESA